MRLGKLPKQEQPEVQFINFMGWEIQTDVLTRRPNSWRRLENLDQFTPGSIRKIVGPSLLTSGFPSPISEMYSQRPHVTDPVTAYGIGFDGNLYNLMSGAFVTNVSPTPYTAPPFTTLFQGTNNGGDAVQYSIITRPGYFPAKYDGTTLTAIGVQAPTAGIFITGIGQSASSTGGIQVQVARQYLWTYWNPQTLHESSPSPVPNSAIISPTNTWPAATTPFISEVVLEVPTGTPNPGDGYTMFRVYATRDGGATFFLVSPLYDGAGNVLTDANGAAQIQGPISFVSDGFYPFNISPVPDPSLITPAPAIGANNPPPQAIWGAVYQSRLWLLDPDRTTLWFSNIGDFESYGSDSFFRFVNLVLNDITAIVPLSDRLVVANKNSTNQIAGTDFSDFVETPVDPSHGIVGRRAAASVGDGAIGLTIEGLAKMAFWGQGTTFLGNAIKPFTDTIDQASWPTLTQITLNAALGMLFCAVKVFGQAYNDKVIVISGSAQSPFSLITGLPAEVITVREVILPDMITHYLISTSDLAVYDLYGGNGSLVAVAETQQLPIDSLDVDKYFAAFWAQGSDFLGWVISSSVDGNPFTPDVPLMNSNMIGYVGKEIVLRFTHAAPDGQAALLSRGALRHVPMTAAR